MQLSVPWANSENSTHKTPEMRWFESNHHDDEIALLSELLPRPQGRQGEIIIMGVAQRSEKPMEGKIRVGSECLRQACQK